MLCRRRKKQLLVDSGLTLAANSRRSMKVAGIKMLRKSITCSKIESRCLINSGLVLELRNRVSWSLDVQTNLFSTSIALPLYRHHHHHYHHHPSIHLSSLLLLSSSSSSSSTSFLFFFFGDFGSQFFHSCSALACPANPSVAFCPSIPLISIVPFRLFGPSLFAFALLSFSVLFQSFIVLHSS